MLKPSKVGVIALVPDTLNGPWMGRHQFLSRLSRHMPVIWVNPPYPWRTVWLNPGPDVVTRTGFSNHESGLVQFHSGRWLPQIFNPRFLAHWFQRTRLRMMVKALKKQGCEKV
ncbi:MAG: hypothetical protein MI808_21285, partial [Pseudomonadales bacterium]|nr:hypothetical protein [Pseudomonadales bacterium]